MADPLYAHVLSDSWERLARPIRHLHDVQGSVRARGRLRVSNGQLCRARVLARALRLPRPAEAADTRLRIIARDGTEAWVRSFDGRQFSTTQHLSVERELIERFGLLEFRFGLDECGGSLLYVQRDAALRFWPVRIRLPRRCAPRIEAREDPAGPHAVNITVRAVVPGVGLVIAYDGVVTVEDASA